MHWLCPVINSFSVGNSPIAHGVLIQALQSRNQLSANIERGSISFPKPKTVRPLGDLVIMNSETHSVHYQDTQMKKKKQQKHF